MNHPNFIEDQQIEMINNEDLIDYQCQIIKSQTESENEYDNKKYEKRIGILGGSFNPPTIGHIQMSIETINLNLVDEVWMVPCGEREDKKYTVTGEQRLAMTRLLVDEQLDQDFQQYIKVDDVEILNHYMIPSFDLVYQYRNKYPQYQFFFIIGSDLLDGLPTWDSVNKIYKEINFIIFQRSQQVVTKSQLPRHYILVNTQFTASSSTEVRKRIQSINKESAGNKYDRLFGMIPQNVIQFIKENQLYQEN